MQHCLESVLMTIWWTTRIIIHDNCYQWIKRAMKLSTTCKLIKIKKNLLKDQRAPLFNGKGVCIRGSRKFCLIHFVIEIYLHLTVDLEDYVIFVYSFEERSKMTFFAVPAAQIYFLEIDLLVVR